MINSAMLEMLRTADDPVLYEAPANFERRKAVAEVRALMPKIAALIGQRLELDDQVQDASFFADLAVYRPSAIPNIIEAPLVIRFSAFGRLFTVYALCAEEACLPTKIVTQVVEAVQQEGFHYVNREALDESYSGVHPYFVGLTWWYRFFDYL